MVSPLVKDIPLFLDDKPSVYALRQKAKDALLATGFPTLKTEAWKYTNIKNLINSPFEINNSEEHCNHDCCHHHTKEPFIEITFCQGKLHIEEYNTPKGLIIIPLPVVLYENEYKNYLFNSFNLEKHPFAALNGMYLEQGICICVEKGSHISEPIHINYHQHNCNNQQIHIHNLIIAERNCCLEVLETYNGDTSFPYLTNVVNEIYLKENATLTHYKIQKEAETAFHIALNAVKQQKNSQYKQFYLSNGAKLSRQETLINLDQEDAKAEIYSAYTAKKECITDITTNINHLKPNTYSNQYAKAVLEDSSVACFQGKIHIAPNAIKTSGHQLHKALYLNDNATLNCKPELEIYADDVKCSHGASCGEIDKEQLFYLTSRGIDKNIATKMLIDAHLEEIFALISNEEIKTLFCRK